MKLLQYESKIGIIKKWVSTLSTYCVAWVQFSSPRLALYLEKDNKGSTLSQRLGHRWSQHQALIFLFLVCVLWSCFVTFYLSHVLLSRHFHSSFSPEEWQKSRAICPLVIQWLRVNLTSVHWMETRSRLWQSSSEYWVGIHCIFFLLQHSKTSLSLASVIFANWDQSEKVFV